MKASRSFTEKYRNTRRGLNERRLLTGREVASGRADRPDVGQDTSTESDRGLETNGANSMKMNGLGECQNMGENCRFGNSSDGPADRFVGRR